MFRRINKHFNDFKLQALNLIETSISIKKTARITDINIFIINRLKQKTRENEFDSVKFTKLNIKHVQNRLRFERSAKIISKKKLQSFNM